MTDENIRFDLVEQLTEELKNEILPFWSRHAQDPDNGGIIGRLTSDNVMCSDAPKSVVLNARVLWTFAAAHRITGDHAYLEMADQTYNYLESNFKDHENGGYYWMLNSDGTPLDTRKQVYAQSFVIYAYAEYYRIRRNKGALQSAVMLYRLTEQYAGTNQGYTEAFDRDWNLLDDVRLSAIDKNETHSLNTHIHILEAYSNLLRVWKDACLQNKLNKLSHHIIDVMYNPENGHFHSFFDKSWTVKSDVYSYGHDIEAAWLLVDAGFLGGDEDLCEKSAKVMIATAQALLNEGINPKNGGVYNLGREGIPLDTEYHWWVQAEAIVGLLYAYGITTDTAFLKAAGRNWTFIQNHVKDHDRGEWFYRIESNGKPAMNEDKIGPWKCPYHNARACLKLMKDFSDQGYLMRKLAEKLAEKTVQK